MIRGLKIVCFYPEDTPRPPMLFIRHTWRYVKYLRALFDTYCCFDQTGMTNADILRLAGKVQRVVNEFDISFVEAWMWHLGPPDKDLIR